MSEAARTIRFIYWEVEPGPLEAGVEYSFAFRAPNGKGVYRVPTGISSAVERLDRWTLEIPEPLAVPEWVKGAIIYQIFPDRFASSGLGDGTGLHPWESEPERWGFKGGDLPGITQRLDYLAELGVDAIYFNPIFTSPSNHRYDTSDYFTVDPLLGGNAALGELVAEAHRRSIRVILDASFNHVHPSFFAFADVMSNGPDSEYWDWFVVSEWPLRLRFRPDQVGALPHLREYLEHLEEEIGVEAEPTSGVGHAIEASYEAWFGVPTMPRVNLANPEARSYMLEVAAYWLREYDVDGWRMDVARYVDPDFWNDFRNTVRRVNPEAYLLAEIMGDTSAWLQGDRFDATMNYTFRDLAIRFLATDDLDGASMVDGLSRMWAQYAWSSTLANQNLIGSHDTPRFLTEAGGEVWRSRLATVLQMTMPGAPGIYYGDEVGLEGGDDPGCRGAFPWESDPMEHEIHRVIRELAGLRRSEPALVTGHWRPMHGADGTIVFQRILEERVVVVALNKSQDPVPYELGESWKEVVWGDGSLAAGVLTIEPRSAVVVA